MYDSTQQDENIRLVFAGTVAASAIGLLAVYDMLSAFDFIYTIIVQALIVPTILSILYLLFTAYIFKYSAYKNRFNLSVLFSRLRIHLYDWSINLFIILILAILVPVVVYQILEPILPSSLDLVVAISNLSSLLIAVAGGVIAILATKFTSRIGEKRMIEKYRKQVEKQRQEYSIDMED